MARESLVNVWLRFVASSFLRNRGLLLASSLSYTTVLSLVPFLAVAFSVAKGFGFYNAPFLREVLLRVMAEKTDVVDAVLGYIQNTNVKALGAIGVATLFVTSLSMLTTMEEAFNIFWRAKTRRALWFRFTNYIAVILVCPVFILAAFSVTASLQSAHVVRWLREISLFYWTFTLALKAAPTVMVFISLFILYKFLPNVRVTTKAAAIGAATASVAWQGTQFLYIRYQIGVTGYNAIYGSFAQIPLLLVWLYISWLIVLVGAEIAHACQNFARIRQEGATESFSVADRRDLALALALMLAERAEKRQPPLADMEAAAVLDLPVPPVALELKRLRSIGAAARVDGGGEIGRYVLAAAPDRITVGELVVAWEGARNGDERDGKGTNLMARLYPELEKIRELLNAACVAGAVMTLRDVLEGMSREPR